MNDKDTEFFWKLIQDRYTISPKTWEDIEEVEPDEFDLAMLKEIEENPECHEFISQEEVLKELGL